MFVNLADIAMAEIDSSFQVCIFAYGQTGSGKSWTMEGGLVHCSPGDNEPILMDIVAG